MRILVTGSSGLVGVRHPDLETALRELLDQPVVQPVSARRPGHASL